jgi:hypothetical protein
VFNEVRGRGHSEAGDLWLQESPKIFASIDIVSHANLEVAATTEINEQIVQSKSVV